MTMVFSGITFLFHFLPLVLIAYAASPRRLRNGVLLLASSIFYVWGAGSLILALIFSIAVDYVLGGVAERGAMFDDRKRQRIAIGGSVIINLGLLAWFKNAG